MVDTGATYCTLPPREAEEVGIVKHPRKFKVILATGEEVKVEAGIISLSIMGKVAPVTALIMGKEPLLGIEALEALGLRVNPKTGKLESTREFARPRLSRVVKEWQAPGVWSKNSNR